MSGGSWTGRAAEFCWGWRAGYWAGAILCVAFSWRPWEILITVLHIRKLRHRTSPGLKRTCSSTTSGQVAGFVFKRACLSGCFLLSTPPTPDPRETKGTKTLIMLVPFVPPQGG